MRTFFSRLPAVVWSGIMAFVLTVVAGGVWTALLIANLAVSPAIPWAVALMALLLWLLWRYLGGAWGSPSTAAARRRYLRANPLPRRVFAWAVAAGVLSVVSLAGLWIVLFQLVTIPTNPLPNFSTYPPLTVALVVVMASLVAAVAEEAGFRGYFQGILEGKVGGPAAIAIAALVIAPAHGLTQGFAWPTLLFYLAVDVMLGAIAYLTNSIVPGLVVHTLGLLTFFTLVWPRDSTRRPVAQGGADAVFWLHIAQTIVFAALAFLAFSRLARSVAASRTPQSRALLAQPAR